MMSQIRYETGIKTVQDIFHLYDHDSLNLEPGFQRESVWKDADRKKLIDSIIRNYPLPSIFFYRREEDGELVYDVLDGKQRIESILMFVGKIRGRKFNIKTQLPNSEAIAPLDWNSLRRKNLQHLVTGYKIQTIEVQGNLSDIIDVFVRINSTGKALTKQEARHAKYINSEFLKKSGSLARRYENYFENMKILSSSQISRQKHIELICELMISAHTNDVINKKTVLGACRLNGFS